MSYKTTVLQDNCSFWCQLQILQALNINQVNLTQQILSVQPFSAKPDGEFTCLSLNSLICASEASNCFLLLGLPDPAVVCWDGFSEGFWELVTDEVKPNGFGEVDGGRVGRGGEGTERGLGEEQRDRGRCWGEDDGSSLGSLGDAVLESAFGDVVRAMGEEVGDVSLRCWVRSASGFELAARPVDWITLKCWAGPSVLDLCWVTGDDWDRAGEETEQGVGTRVGAFEGIFLSWGSSYSDLAIFEVLLPCNKTWGSRRKSSDERGSLLKRHKKLISFSPTPSYLWFLFCTLLGVWQFSLFVFLLIIVVLIIFIILCQVFQIAAEGAITWAVRGCARFAVACSRGVRQLLLWLLISERESTDAL